MTARLIERARRDGDSGSLAIAILFLLVGVSITALLSPRRVPTQGHPRSAVD